jgi:hypothetical protein
MPNAGFDQRFLEMTSLVKKYNNILSATTRHQAFNLALAVLTSRAHDHLVIAANDLFEYMLTIFHTVTFQNAIRDFRHSPKCSSSTLMHRVGLSKASVLKSAT